MTPRRRVLMIGSLPLAAPWNGADKNIARAIVSTDSATEYHVQSGTHELWPEGVVVRRTERPGAMPTLRERLASARLLMTGSSSVDVVHMVASVVGSNSLPARALTAWSRVTRMPIVHTVPGVGVPLVRRELFPGATTVVFSDDSANRLMRAGVPDVVHVFPPLDLASIVANVDGAFLRHELRLGSRPILYPTHLDHDNGIREAILALAQLRPELGAVSLVVAARGRSHQNLDAALDELRSFALEVGVADRVVLLHDVAEMHDLIAACELTILVPRELHGKMDLPLVILEAHALHRPVIITDRPPLSEALLGGGVAVPFGDVEALAAEIDGLMMSSDRRRRLALEGRRRLVELVDRAWTADSYRRLYEQVLWRRPVA